MATFGTMSRQARSEQTRTSIIDAALELFSAKGYEATTMRAVAEAAGVSLGNAYYYFDSKEQLIQGFYHRAAADHALVMPEKLAGLTSLEDRMIAYLDAWFDLMDPYHEFASAFFRNAADPRSPLSPFSPESASAREESVAMVRDLIEGSSMKITPAIRGELPELLWLFHMGCVLFWVYDGSHGAMASKLLVRRTVPMVVRAIDLARLPVLKATVVDLIALVSDLRMMLAPPPPT